MNPTNWTRAAALAALLTLPAFSGCNQDMNTPASTNKGGGNGTLGTPDSGGDNSPRRGSAATGVDKPGPG